MTARKTLIVALVGVFLTLSCMAAFAQGTAKANTYMGIKNCKMCHSKDATGNQYTLWEKSPHAKAYASLATPEAKAKAKELGIDDPQKSEKCLSCHVTAFSVMKDLTTQKITLEEGVSCESCHGPGSAYAPMKVMKDVLAGTIKPESVGLIAKPDEKLCVTCHKAEGNPFHKEFKFAEFAKKIAHPIPKAGG
jgi:hypothetical protein